MRHHRCYETSRPQQMATGTVLRPSQSSEARHSGIPLTFLAYLQRPATFSRARPSSSASVSGGGALVEIFVKDPIRPFQGKGAPHLDVAPGGHRPVSAPTGTPHCTRSFVCELGLTLRRSDPLKTTSILLLGSSFSAKTEG